MPTPYIAKQILSKEQFTEHNVNLLIHDRYFAAPQTGLVECDDVGRKRIGRRSNGLLDEGGVAGVGKVMLVHDVPVEVQLDGCHVSAKIAGEGARMLLLSQLSGLRQRFLLVFG